MLKNATGSYNLNTPPKRTPLFSRLGVFLLTVGMLMAFFISQLLGVYIAGKLVLPASKNSTMADIFFLVVTMALWSASLLS